MDDVTSSLGWTFRQFNADVCSAYNTKELAREAKARRRRKNPDTAGKAIPTASDERHNKTFNLQTYKYHSLDDYVQTIRRLGTTDSYSTTTVSIF
jgi:hypothetical protein